MKKNVDDDVGKYKKRTKSNTSKAKEKSKHKHEYAEFLLINNRRPHRAEVCTVCGKINNLHFFETEKCEIGYRQLSSEEVFEKYKGLKQIEIDDIWQKYVPI